MQQFNFLLLATYTAQMVFVKTFSHQNTSVAMRNLQSFGRSQTKFSCCNGDGRGLRVEVSSYRHSIKRETLAFVKL